MILLIVNFALMILAVALWPHLGIEQLTVFSIKNIDFSSFLFLYCPLLVLQIKNRDYIKDIILLSFCGWLLVFIMGVSSFFTIMLMEVVIWIFIFLQRSDDEIVSSKWIVATFGLFLFFFFLGSLLSWLKLLGVDPNDFTFSILEKSIGVNGLSVEMSSWSLSAFAIYFLFRVYGLNIFLWNTTNIHKDLSSVLLMLFQKIIFAHFMIAHIDYFRFFFRGSMSVVVWSFLLSLIYVYKDSVLNRKMNISLENGLVTTIVMIDLLWVMNLFQSVSDSIYMIKLVLVLLFAIFIFNELKIEKFKGIFPRLLFLLPIYFFYDYLLHMLRLAFDLKNFLLVVAILLYVFIFVFERVKMWNTES